MAGLPFAGDQQLDAGDAADEDAHQDAHRGHHAVDVELRPGDEGLQVEHDGLGRPVVGAVDVDVGPAAGQHVYLAIQREVADDGGEDAEYELLLDAGKRHVEYLPPGIAAVDARGLQ